MSNVGPGFQRPDSQSLKPLHQVLAQQNSASAASALIPAQSLSLAAPRSTLDAFKASTPLKLDARAANSLVLQPTLKAAPPPSPISSEKFFQVTQAYQDEVRKMLEQAPSGSKLATYKNSLSALHMSTLPDWAAKIDKPKLDAKIQALAKDPEVLNAFEVSRRRVIARSFGAQGAPVHQIKAHLLSDRFSQRLQQYPTAQRQQIVAHELQKIALLGPNQLEDITQRLAGKMMLEGGLEAYRSLPAEKTQAALSDLITETGDVLAAEDHTGEGRGIKAEKGGKKSSKALRETAKQVSMALDRALRELPEAIQDNPQELIKSLAQKYGANGAKAAHWLSSLEKTGKLGALDAVLATVNLVTTGVPTDLKSAGSSVSSLFSALSKAEDLAKVLGTSKDSLKLYSTTFKTMKWLGPIGDTLSAGIDGYGSYKDFKDGDLIGGTAKGVAAAASTTGAALGALMLAGKAGNKAPYVIAGSAVVGLVAWGVDATFGEKPEETLLRKLGVLKND